MAVVLALFAAPASAQSGIGDVDEPTPAPITPPDPADAASESPVDDPRRWADPPPPFDDHDPPHQSGNPRQDPDLLPALLGSGGLVGGFFLFWCGACVVWLLAIVFWIWMLVDCVRKEFPGENEKIVWVLIVVLAGPIGAIVYFFVGRPKGTLPYHDPRTPPPPRDPTLR